MKLVLNGISQSDRIRSQSQSENREWEGYLIWIYAQLLKTSSLLDLIAESTVTYTTSNQITQPYCPIPTLPPPPPSSQHTSADPGLRIRIHFIRIRIQHFRLNTDPDPDPIRIRIQSGSRALLTKNWKQKFSWKKNIFFGSKTTIYLSLDLHKEHPSYRRSLQLSKEAIQHFKTWTLKKNFYFCGSFLPSWIRIHWPD